MKRSSSHIIFHSAASQFISYLATLLIGFLLLPYIVNKLGNYEYGLWALVTSILGNVTLFQLGLGSSVQNHLAQESGKQDVNGFNRIFTNGIVIFIFISCLLFSAITVFSVWGLISNQLYLSQTVIWTIFILGINLSVSFAVAPYSSVLSAQLRYDIIAGVTLVQSILNAILTIISLYLGYTLVALAIVFLISGTLSNVLIYFFAKFTFPALAFRREYITRTTMNSLARYSGKSFLTQLGDILRFRVDEIVTGSLIGINQVTNYSIANRLVTAANGPTASVLGLLNSLFARYHGIQDLGTMRQSLQLSMKLSGAISAATLAALVLLGKPFIASWFGTPYLVAYGPIVLLGLAYFLARIQSPAVSMFYAIDKHEYFAYINLFEGALNLILSVWFVQQFHLGINGVALGTLVPILISKLLVQPLWVPGFIQMSIQKYYQVIGIILFSTFTIYGILYWLGAWYVPFTSYWHFLLVLMALPFCLLLQLQLILERNEKKVLLSSVRGRFSLGNATSMANKA